eukprot:55401-Eustigmatos_ZCMA.PRE.1
MVPARPLRIHSPAVSPLRPIGGSHSGQSRLRRVLHAYSRIDPEVGYCQGMGFVTAMLLTYFTGASVCAGACVC